MSIDTEQEEPKVGLAIESAIGGGSISLLSDRGEIDHWIGDGGISRAEDLLPNISELMQRHSISLKMIGGIVVSVGPGSYTGIRIGIATALGLKNSLKVSCTGVSALEAMASSSDTSGRVIAAVPMGRGIICFQIFETDGRGGLSVLSEPSASKSVPKGIFGSADYDEIIVHESLYQTIKIEVLEASVRNAGSNLAYLIAKAGAISEYQRALKPIFVSSAK